MDRTETRRRESVIALLAFVWGVQFALLILLFWSGLWVDDSYRLYGTMGPAQVLTTAGFVCGAAFGIWLLAGQAWRHMPRAWRLDAAFAYMALVPVSPVVFFGAAGEPWKSEVVCLAAGIPLALGYLVARVIPGLRERRPGEEEFP